MPTKKKTKKKKTDDVKPAQQLAYEFALRIFLLRLLPTRRRYVGRCVV